MDNLLVKMVLGLIKGVLGMKFGLLLLIVVASIVGITLIKNIFSGSFNIAKFAGGFNIFTGSVQGKLIYYGLLAILAFGLYHQLTRATYDTDYTSNYKNNIVWNRDVAIDQRQIIPPTPKCYGLSLGGTCLGFTFQGKINVKNSIVNKGVKK
jgi:hypothetical protein